MKLSINLTKRLLLLFIPAIVLSSCIKEREIGADNKKQFTLTLNVPGNTKAMTRAISENDEYEVREADVLVFDNSQDGTGKYIDYAYGKNQFEDISFGSDRKLRFTVDLVPETGIERYDFMVLTNSRKAIQAAGLTKGMTRAQVQQAITEQIAAGTGWIAKTSNADYKAIPMWGEMKYRKMSVSENYSVSVIRMLAKIDLSINLNTSAGKHDVDDEFEFSEVKLYNYNTKGYLIPTDGTMGVNAQGKPKVTTPTPHTASLVTGATNLIDYTGKIPADGADKGKLIREIYTFEAPAGSLTDFQNNICLVFKGTYTPKSGTATTGWYRVDFANRMPDLTTDYLAIKRNHHYNVVITLISGKGYGTEKEAYESLPMNIENSILEWEDNEMSDVVFDGQYKMGVSEKAYTFSKEQSLNNALSIYTTYTATDLVVKYSNSETNADAVSTWLTQSSIVNDGGSDMRKYNLKFNAAQNDYGSARTGYIHLFSGRMHMVVKVEQSDVTASMLTSIVNNIQQDGMEFAAANGVDPGEKKFKIQWSPRSETLFASLAPVANPAGGNYDALIWDYYNTLTGSGALDVNGTTVYVTPVTDPTGEVEFTIKPKPITNGMDGVNLTTNPFYERQIQINYRATGAMGMMRKSFTIQQYVYNMVPKLDGFYLADGSQYSFKVQSNRQWKAYLIDNGGGMVEKAGESNNIDVSTPGSGILIGQGGYNVESGGTKVYFKTINDLANPTLILGTAKVRIEWLKNGNDPAVEANWDKTTIVDLMCGSRVDPSVNCFMVNGTNTIEIPTRQVAIAMGLNDKPTEQNPTTGYLGMSWITPTDYQSGKLKAAVLWTDIPKAYGAADAVVKNISYDGSKHVAGGKIIVTPGTGVGNAVICLYIDDNSDGKYTDGEPIKWSWHIWNAGYFPYQADGKTPNTIWMDRNLGATTNTVNTASTLGYMYQWGRKDPIVGSAATTGTTLKTIYKADGVTTYTKTAWTATGGNTLAGLVSNPSLPYSDNIGSIAVSDATNNSWGGGSLAVNDKTVFDPCPEGYRVPAYVNQNNTTATHYWGNETSSIGIKWTTSGILWDTKGAYYPAAGYRSDSDLNFVGTHGYCWSASPSGASAYRLYFNSAIIYPTRDGGRPITVSARCVAE